MHEALTWTFPNEREPSRVGPWARRGSAGVVALCSLAALVVTIDSASNPGGSSFDAILLLVFLTFAGLAALACLVVSCAVTRRFNPALVAPVVAVALMAFVDSSDLPLQARFALSQPAFEQAVAARTGGGDGAPCPTRIGAYRVDSCQNEGPDIYFAVPGGIFGPNGFAYLPDGPPTGEDQIFESVEPLSGSWYTFATD